VDGTKLVLLSEDPIGFRGRDSNLARYVQNQATFLIDPTGETPPTFPIFDLLRRWGFLKDHSPPLAVAPAPTILEQLQSLLASLPCGYHISATVSIPVASIAIDATSDTRIPDFVLNPIIASLKTRIISELGLDALLDKKKTTLAISVDHQAGCTGKGSTQVFRFKDEFTVFIPLFGIREPLGVVTGNVILKSITFKVIIDIIVETMP
jgi:hypothetical protein